MALCNVGKITLKVRCLSQVILFYTVISVTFSLYGKFNAIPFLDPSREVRI